MGMWIFFCIFVDAVENPPKIRIRTLTQYGDEENLTYDSSCLGGRMERTI